MTLIKKFQRRAIASPPVIPPGIILPYPGTVAPSGWLISNGTEILRTDAPDLWAMAQSSDNLVTEAAWQTGITGNVRYYRTCFSSGNGSTFRIPDYRGVFIRGFDGGAGVDSGRVFGTLQLDQMQGHYHAFTYNHGPGGTNPNNLVSGVNAFDTISATAIRSPVSDGINGNPRTGTQTRPINAAPNYIMKL